MKFFLLFLILVLCESCDSQKASVSLDKHQEAIANEIVSIEYAGGDALLRLNNTNAVNFVAEMDSFSDRLDKISKELDMLGSFPPSLREATLKKLDAVEKALSPRLQIKVKSISPQPEFGEIIASALARNMSANLSVKDKAGLLIETNVNPVDLNTNGMKPPNHP